MAVRRKKAEQKNGAAKPAVHWGASNIARRIGRSERSTFHILESGQLLGAGKIAGRWFLPESAARELFGPPVAK